MGSGATGEIFKVTVRRGQWFITSHNTGTKGTQGTGKVADSEISKKLQLFAHSGGETLCNKML